TVRRGEDEAVLAGYPAVVVVDELHTVERGVGSRWQDLPVHAAVLRLDDLPAVADHDRTVLAERLDVVETVRSRVDRALDERRHLDFAMAPQCQRNQHDPQWNRPTAHAAPSLGAVARTTHGRDVTNRPRKCQWGVASLGLVPFGNHWACSAGSSRTCESTFQAPFSRIRV